MPIKRSMPRGGYRKHAGRPKKDPADVASIYVPIHMTPAERELCQVAADAEKLSLARWGRNHLVAIASKLVGN